MKLKIASLLIIIISTKIFSQNKHNVYFDKELNKIISLQYDDSFAISNELYSVKKKNYWGIVDKSNNIVLEIAYDGIQPLNKNVVAIYDNSLSKIALFRHNNKKATDLIQVINKVKKIKFLSKFEYNDVLPLDKDVFLVSKNDLWALSTNTAIATNYEYASIKEFHDGLSVVSKIYNGFINKSGTVIIPLKYENSCDFHEGIAAVKSNGKWGFINDKGQTIIPFEYQEARNCYNGIIPVKKNNKWIFINKNKTVLAETNYYDIKDFDTNGLAEFIISKNQENYRGLINTEFHEVIIPEYKRIDQYGDNYSVTNENRLEGYFDKKGNITIPVIYENIEHNSDNLKHILINEKYGLINSKTNKIIVDPKYDYILSFPNSFASIRLGEKWGIVDENGKEIIPIEYEELRMINGVNYFIAKKDNKLGIIDEHNKILLPFEYEYIEGYVNQYNAIKCIK